MVLGFGSKKKKGPPEPQIIKPSPSLPQLNPQGIPWPEDLVDIASVQASLQPHGGQKEHGGGGGGGRRTSFQLIHGIIPKPFRAGPGSPISQGGDGSAFLAKDAPPSAFNNGSARTRARSQPLNGSARLTRKRNPPTFNVMVVGARKTGKSSLLRLLLDTSALSSANSDDQLSSLATFRSACAQRTQAISTACVEIVHPHSLNQAVTPGRLPSPDERLTLTCIDTPGLDFSEGKELALDRAVSALVRYLDLQYAETMGEESKVVRTSKGDQHVHLCIYLIEPDSLMTPMARAAQSAPLPRHTFPLSGHSDDAARSEYDSGSDEEDEDEKHASSIDGHSTLSESDYGEPEEDNNDRAQTPKQQPSARPRSANNRLEMREDEIKVIKRLARRVNVLPVIARADTLTDGRLARVKKAVRRDLAGVLPADSPRAGTGSKAGENAAVDVFALWDADPGKVVARKPAAAEPPLPTDRKSANGHGHAQDEEEEEEDEQERQSRPVIKLRDRGTGTARLTRSRSRRSLRSVVGSDFDDPPLPASENGHQGQDEPLPVPPLGPQAWRSSVRSTATTAGGGVPFGLTRAELRARIPFAVIAPERERRPADTAPNGFNGDPGAVPEGQYVRRYRWGTVDVLNPDHCDFTALKTAVLWAYMRAMKSNTKEVLYEQYRTEKLLARRATHNISEEERKRILEDLGL